MHRSFGRSVCDYQTFIKQTCDAGMSSFNSSFCLQVHMDGRFDMGKSTRLSILNNNTRMDYY